MQFDKAESFKDVGISCSHKTQQQHSVYALQAVTCAVASSSALDRVGFLREFENMLASV